MNQKTYHPVFGSTAAQYNMADNFRRAFPDQPQAVRTRIQWRTIGKLLAIGLFFALCWYIGVPK